MASNLLQASFAAGEFSPSLYSRTDLAKYASAAALMRNWIVDYRGGASNRPGTRFVGQCLTGGSYFGQPRLIPFIVGTEAAYVLEFGNGYFRVIADAAYVIDPGTLLPVLVATPYSVFDLPALKFAQSANVLTITHPSYPIHNLRRVSATSFTLTEEVIGPTILPPSGVITVQKNGTTTPILYGYVVTAVSASGQESVPTRPSYLPGEVLNQNTGIVNEVIYATVDDAIFYRIYKSGPTASGVGNNATPPSVLFGYIGQSTTTSFVDNNIAQDFSQTPPLFQDPFAPGQIASVERTAGGAGYTDYTYSLLFFGDGTGASGYAICDITSGVVEGVVLTNPGRDYTTCIVVDTGPNTATYSVTLGQQSGTYPAAVGYYQQRRVFGGTTNFPEAMVFSQPGAYSNFNTNPIVLDTDSITASLASRQVNAIKSFTALSSGLIVLTTGEGFLVSGGSPEAALTPSSISALPQPSSGCNDLPPLVINYDVLYAQNRGAVVRDLAFNFYVQSYSGTDRSVLASHLFTDFTLNEWAWSEEPFRLVQVVRSDGTLLNFTYVPEQEIFAWTSTVTNGQFVSIASIPEGTVNATYVIVLRLVQNAQVYYIERFDSRLFEGVENAWFLDSALHLPGTFPAGNINIEDDGGVGLLGEFVLINSAPAVFGSGDVGKAVWAGGGWGMVTAYNTTSQIRVQVLRPFPRALGDPARYAFFASGEWELDAMVTSVSGLDHLEGQTVSALCDGVPVAGLEVQSGIIHIPSCSKAIAGLPYVADLQTLRLDAGDPTIQGKRKQISSVTAIVNQTSELACGMDFDHLSPMKELISPYPPALVSNLALSNLRAVWNKSAQMCFRQSLPLPATILGLIPEVLVGDTMR